MRAMVIYESMHGNTRIVAEAVARGLGPSGEVRVLPGGKAQGENLADCDLVVVGGPRR